MNPITIVLVVCTFYLQWCNSETINVYDSILCNSILTNAINEYRKDLICSQAVTHMEFIHFDQTLVNRAKELMETEITPNSSHLFITADTCGYSYEPSESVPFNVDKFIQQCIREAADPNSYSRLWWLMYPQYTTIGCALSKQNFILCVFNQVDSRQRPFLQIDSSKAEIDEWKQQQNIFTYTCSNRLQANYKSCYMLSKTRQGFIRELNILRENLATKWNYTNMQFIDWDYDLEIAAIEISQYELTGNTGDQCLSLTKFTKRNEIGVYAFDAHLPIKSNFDTIMVELIKNATATNKKSDDLEVTEYFWMYDTEVYALGCTFYVVSEMGNFLCVFNSDPKRILNIQKGASCSKCSCRNLRYPRLCTQPVLAAIATDRSFGNAIGGRTMNLTTMSFIFYMFSIRYF